MPCCCCCCVNRQQEFHRLFYSDSPNGARLRWSTAFFETVDACSDIVRASSNSAKNDRWSATQLLCCSSQSHFPSAQVERCSSQPPAWRYGSVIVIVPSRSRSFQWVSIDDSAMPLLIATNSCAIDSLGAYRMHCILPIAAFLLVLCSQSRNNGHIV